MIILERDGEKFIDESVEALRSGVGGDGEVGIGDFEGKFNFGEEGDVEGADILVIVVVDAGS